MRIDSAKDLEVYKKAYELAMKIFQLSKDFPPEERFALTGQIRKVISVGVFEFTGGLGEAKI